jgi:imidazolonepropionase-like amidohydrolase
MLPQSGQQPRIEGMRAGDIKRLPILGVIHMTYTLSVFLLGSMLLATCPAWASPGLRLASQPVVVQGGQVFDGTGGDPMPNGIIVIEGARIKAIGPSHDVAIPPGARLIDARGKSVIPGLIDAHVHYQDWMEPLFLSHGVTTVRDVGNNLEMILTRRQWSQKTGAKHPRLFACGPLIDGPNPRWGAGISRAVSTSDEARTVARELLERGVDCLKAYEQLTPTQLRALVQEATPHSVPVTAHLGKATAAEAMTLGIRALEHASGINYLTATGEELQALARQVASIRVFLVPTLVVHEQLSRLLSPEVRRDPLLRHLPPQQFEWWEAPYGVGRWTDAHSARNRDILARKRAWLGEVAKAGGRIVAGSDTPNPYVLPGSGLQRELELLVAAGLTPLQAITAATQTAAELLGQEDRLGSLRVGKVADLVILGGNPAEDIRQVREVERVLRDGQVVWPRAQRVLIPEAVAGSSPDVPLPSNIEIIVPEPGVGLELAAFSGAWTGRWDGVLEHRLVVEDIDPPTARVIYAWGSGVSRPGWTRVRGELVEGMLTLRFPHPATVTYRVQAGGTLDATYQWPGGSSRTQMTRMSE